MSTRSRPLAQRWFTSILILVIAFSFLLMPATGMSAQTSAVQLTPAINESDGLADGQATNTVFRDVTVSVQYEGGPICLSSQPGGCASAAIDDAVRIFVNGSQVLYQESYTNDFGPVDFSGFLQVGQNQVRVQLIDLMGPSRGGSALWLVPSSGVDILPVEVVSVSQSAGLVEMGAEYSLSVTVHNPNNSAASGTVKLKETGARPDFQDQSYGELSKVVTLQANETKTVEFGPFQHRWNWLGNMAAECYTAKGLILNLTVQWVGDLGKVLKYLATGFDIGQIASAAGQSMPTIFYHYEASADFEGLSSAGKDAWVTVDVPWHKKNQFLASFGMDLTYPELSGIAVIAAAATGEPAPLLLLAIEAIGWQASCDALANASDPDSNYTIIAEIEPIVVSAIQALPSSPHKSAAYDALSYLSALRALNTSLARYEGAKEANDSFWMEAQLRASRWHAANTVYALSTLNDSLHALVASVRGSQTQLTPEEVAQIGAELEANGLPELERQILTELGWDQVTIDQLPTLVMAYLASDPEWPVYVPPAQLTIPNYLTLREGTNARLGELVGPTLDTIAPTTAIALQGSMGNNDWYVSDVTVLLTATDNLGGSGVAKVQWSLDNGRTWNNYDGNLIHTQEGRFHLIARAIDTEGNIEYPPAAADFKVDKTPPVVNVWTDQTAYTRVQPFIVHYTAVDPEPGSGIASTVAFLNGQSVVNEQVIDLFWWDLGQYAVQVTAIDNAGWQTVRQAPFNLVANIPSLLATVDRLCTMGEIWYPGGCTSLTQKLRAAQGQLDAGNKIAAGNILQAFIREVMAQKGKGITIRAASILIMDATYAKDHL